MVGSPTLSRSVEYTFELVDNITPIAEKSEARLRKLEGAVEGTTESINTQNISYIKAVASMGAFRHGLRSLVMGLEELGIVSKKTNENLYRGVAVVDAFVGSALMIKGLVPVMTSFYNALVSVSAVETYRKVLANPAYLAVAAMGIGAAGAAIGYFYGKSQQQAPSTSTTTVTQNVNFLGPGGPTARYAARSSLEGAGM